MSEHRAAALAITNQIESHWATRLRQPEVDAYADVIAQVGEGAVGTALARLKRNDKPPSPRDLLVAAASLQTRRPTEHCDDCGGSGWAPCALGSNGRPVQHRRLCATNRTGDDCDCSGVSVPCRCPDGRRAEEQLERHWPDISTPRRDHRSAA